VQTQELFVSAAIIIVQIIGIVVFVVVFVFVTVVTVFVFVFVFVGGRSGGGGFAIFLIREFRTGMCGTLLYFGPQILHTREQVLQTRGQVLPTRLWNVRPMTGARNSSLRTWKASMCWRSSLSLGKC
jgi:hypothetical protein